MGRPLSRKILHGQEEPIFDHLPQSVIANFDRPRSENALLWNIFYPRSMPGLEWKRLAALRPCWGSGYDLENEPDEKLEPYFWGYNITGERLSRLDPALAGVDGPGPKTEVDLFLIGSSKLVVVEAKHTAALGRCSRYQAGRCPEIHSRSDSSVEPCRYWEDGAGRMEAGLEMGSRPIPGDTAPACNLHYQLARIFMVGCALQQELDLELHVWLVLPRRSWRSFETTWLDFTRRVRQEKLWRRMRVLAWEELQSYAP